MSKLTLYQQAANPSAPSAGAVHLFVKTDDKLYYQLDDASVHPVLTGNDVGSAAYEDITFFATAAQGAKADTAAQATNKLNFFAATTSAELAGVISDETGSGSLVFATGPTLTTPVISDRLHVVGPGTAALPAIYMNNDGNSGLWSPADNEIAIAINTFTRMLFNTSGVVVGAGVTGIQAISSSITPGFQMSGTGNNAAFSNIRWSANTSGPRNVIGKSRGASIGTHTKVEPNDNIAQNYYEGSDGTEFQIAAGIEIVCSGATSTGVVPADIRFRTTNTSGTVTTAAIIDNAQKVVIGGTAALTLGQNNRMQVAGSTTVVGGTSNAHFSTTSTAAQAPRQQFGKSHHSTIGTNAIVVANEVLGVVDYYGANGTGWDLAAQRIVEVAGTPGAAADMPGRIRDMVTPDGSGTSLEVLRQESVASAVNYIKLLNAAAGAGPELSAQGTDANIDLRLSPLGTGVIRSGTRTAIGAETITHYMPWKLADGTSVKVALVGP